MSNRQITIAIDAMGGENSPLKVLKGVEIFSKNKNDIKIILFGNEDLIKSKIENEKIIINNYSGNYNLFNLNFINFFNNKTADKDLKIIINEKFCNNYYNEFSSIAQNYISINC